ncbi:hypothetical protein V5O48_011773 [Marasmius crinis-equi]|uniref:F-box domain-containing protein n=1 Tax=Marasmius crinis-equi TaxID=585013 RepID=A0ABR3F4M0_9AGAR
MDKIANKRPVFPPEIFEHIVDEVGDSFSTLKSCSLVSHDWLPRSRQHLFRSITLPAMSSDPRNVFTDIAPSETGGESMLLELLHSSPLLVHFVQKLTLDFRYSSQLVRVSEPLLIDLGPKINRLRELTLFMLPMHEFPSGMGCFLPDLLRANPSLETISIDSCAFEDARSFWELLRHTTQVSRLKHLSLSGMVLRRFPSDRELEELTEDCDGRPTPRKCAQLQTLELSQMSSFPLLSAIFIDPNASLFGLSDLRRVKIRDIGALFFYADLLRAVGSSITHLDFEVGKYVRDEYIQPHFPTFTSLTHLTLSVAHSRSQLPNLLTVLSHIHLIPTLCHLHIVWPHLNTPLDVLSDISGCIALDVTLAGMKGLAEIVVEMRCHCWQGAADLHQSEVLPRTDRTGILDLRVVQVSGYTMFGDPIFCDIDE